MASTDVQRLMNDDIRRNIHTFDDAVAAVAEVYGNLVDTEEVLGDGFAKLVDKGHLVGKRFIIVDFKFEVGDFGDDYVFVRVVTEDNKKYFFTDGGTGIRVQLRTLAQKDLWGGILVNNGLVVSEYEYEDERGKMKPAKTYYLAQ